jgi:hypothetical protein
VAISFLPYQEISKIIDHFEKVFNAKIQQKNKATIALMQKKKDYWKKHKKMPYSKDKIGRF